ncbi:ATP-binding protein [Alteromonas sp. a30]|uniref:ATP-binding protein n=1 Tax=Alteromonas sp. a30 TaxID=2730917 RepID=UPI0022831918|nr:ATP-binding protein [Alteromonas sp. a30]MCY7294787.1 hypothetical protein [Alteromonas sp. a30]
MKNLFFRLYILLIATFIGLGWSIEALYDSYSQTQALTTDIELHKGTLFLLSKELIRHTPETQAQYLEAVAPSFGYPVKLLTISELAQLPELQDNPISEQQRHYLVQGGIVAIFDDFEGTSWFLYRLTGSDKLLVLGPIMMNVKARSEVLFIVLFFAFLALITFIWAWPISKGLARLSKSAIALGKGDWSVRVDTRISATLRPLAERFNAMASRIQRLIKSHKELSHAVSHELRTPIARIRFAMEMVKDVDSEEARNKYINSMDDSIEALDSLVDELLTYARFDREDPQLNILSHDLERIITEVVNKFELTHPHLQFEVLWSDDSAVFLCDCDDDAIARMLDNLIRNAVRYANTKITICATRKETNVQLSVNDDGPGIPESSWSSIFDPFVRLDKSRDRNSGGIGLGLAIVKRYIELHEGNIRLERSELGGARFILSWPEKRMKQE